MQPKSFADIKARLMLVAIGLMWGLTWPALKTTLLEMPPFSMRTVNMFVGAAVVIGVALLKGRSLRIPPGKRLHVILAGLFNIFGFGLLVAVAQIEAATTRVAVLSYTMPIWAALMAYVALGERITVSRVFALLLCITGIVILIRPLMAGHVVPHGLLLALGGALSWSVGTVYLKWANIKADPIAITAWQLVASFVAMALCLPVMEGTLYLWPLSGTALFALMWTSVIGVGLTYFMWFDVVGRIPAATASLGVLSVPLIGVIGTVIVIGERPTLTDLIGFTLIFAAAACVLLTPTVRVDPRAETSQSQ